MWSKVQDFQNVRGKVVRNINVSFELDVPQMTVVKASHRVDIQRSNVKKSVPSLRRK